MGLVLPDKQIFPVCVMQGAVGFCLCFLDIYAPSVYYTIY